MDKKSYYQKLKDHLIIFLVRQVNPPPLLFFSMYIYFHLKVELSDYHAYTFFISGLLFALIFSYNHFYLYSPVLNAGIGYWSILNLFMGLLATNEKWKLYLYVFLIGDSITMQYGQIAKVYTICCSLYLWVDTYRNVIFNTIQDNIMFFTGFFTIFIYQLFSKLVESVQGYQGIPYFTVPFALLIGYKLILNRVQTLKKKSIEKIGNVEQVYHYICLVRQQIRSPFSRQGFIQAHRLNCSNVDCFCHNDCLTEGQVKGNVAFGTKVQYYFIRSLYQQVLSVTNMPKRELLYNKFIEFLLQNNQITEAIELYTKLQSLYAKFYYFRWVERMRIYNKIQQKLRQFNYFNVFQKEFLYVFRYDNSYLYLASQIKEILKKKNEFWKQVGKQTPLMVKLQSLGSQIVQMMYQLNKFYYKQVKKQQQKINNFNGTIMYAMYLLSTTNYKQYAQSLIKNTSRTLQSIKIHEDNIAETYGLKIVIRDVNKSCNQNIQTIDAIVQSDEVQSFMNGVDGSHLQQEIYAGMSQNKESQERAKRFRHFYQNGFVEIITNVSGPLCKLLKTSKNILIGKDLNTIIPVSYQERHHSKLQKILHYDKRTNKQIVNLSFIKKIRQVPLRTLDNKLINTKLSVKICESLGQGISFIGLVQTINDNKVTVITNLDGQVQQSQEGFGSMSILYSEEITSVLAELKQQWEQESKISTKNINFIFQDNNFSVSFSSPYQVSFLQQTYRFSKESYQQNIESQDESKKLFHKSGEFRVNLSPPIHIDLINESLPYLMNPKQDREQQMTKCIKKMESVFYKTDIDSQASTSSSRKSSVVNVLMSFSENNFIPFYGYIMLVFSIILIGALTANSIGYSQLALPWNNSIKEKNPIINILSIMDIRSLMIETVSHQMDLAVYRTNLLINRTKVNGFYGLIGNRTYPRYVRELMNRMEGKYKQAVSSTSMYVSDVLAVKVEEALRQIIPTTNPANPNEDKRTQRLPLQNIFMNYLVDLNLLALGKPYARTICSLNFWSTIQYVLTRVSLLNQSVFDAIQNSVLLNILYCTIIAVTIVLSTIPIYILLKRRVKRHIDIYDLIVSVQGQLIRQQLKKLANIISIVNNSNQSSEVLKTNTINYLARKRSSAVNDEFGGGSNEMIQGLIQQKNDLMTQRQSHLNQYKEKNSQLLAKKKTDENIQFSSRNDQNQGEGMLAQGQHKKLAMRKRSGELDLRGSQGDFKRVVIKHWLLYLIILISSFALFAIAASKITYFKSVKQSVSTLYSVYDNFIQESLLLLNAKIFFRDLYVMDFPYHQGTFAGFVEKTVYDNTALNFKADFNEEQVYPACLDKSQDKPNYLFCQSSYSLLSLRQQINQYIKQSYQVRLNLNTQYNLRSNNITLLPQTQLKQVSQHFFYVQSMKDRLSNLSYQYNQKVLRRIFQQDSQLNQKLNVIFIVGLGWGVLCLVLGVVLINYMKNLYFKEIIIVSFLNNEMISKNKRVESFLQTLSKSAY